MKKNLKIEYLLLPPNGSHVQELLYRVIKRGPVYATWIRAELPKLGFTKNGPLLEMEKFAKKLSDLIPSLKGDKIKVYECEIVRRKDGRPNKKKNAQTD